METFLSEFMPPYHHGNGNDYLEQSKNLHQSGLNIPA